MAAAEVVHINETAPAPVSEFGTFMRPETFFRNMELVAASFKVKANQLQLFKTIGTSQHLLVEGWQMLAACYRVSAALESDKFVVFGQAEGFEATYTAIHQPSGRIVSRGTAMCLNNEENWGPRPRYEKVNGKRVMKGYEPTPLQQIRSMAQTRAQSKCLSNLLKYVARAAGFSATPGEEMDGAPAGDGTPETQRPQATQQQTSNGSNGQATGNVITEGQSKRLYAISKGVNMPKNVLDEIVFGSGFNTSADITRDKYDAIVAKVEGWKA